MMADYTHETARTTSAQGVPSEQVSVPIDAAIREMMTTPNAQMVLSAVDSLTFAQHHGEIMNAPPSDQADLMHMVRVLSPRYTDLVGGLFAAIWYEISCAEGHVLNLFLHLDQSDLARLSQNPTVQDALRVLIPLYALHQRDEHMVALMDAFFGRGCTAEEQHQLGIPCWNLSERDRIDILIFLFLWYMGWYNPVPPERKYHKRYRLLLMIDEIEALLICSTQDRQHFLDVLLYLARSLGSYFSLWLNSHESDPERLNELKQALDEPFLTQLTHDLIGG